MVFTEGTVLMHLSGKGVSRKERVVQVKEESPDVTDYANYIPIENASNKLKEWKSQGAEIHYLTSRRRKSETEHIRRVLNKYGFPKGELFFRKEKEEYKDVAERVMPDILIEDDCESIGGEAEMTYPQISKDQQKKIKSVVVPEFGGIDHLTNNIEELSLQG